MKPAFLPLLVFAAALSVAACNPVTDFATDERGAMGASSNAEPSEGSTAPVWNGQDGVSNAATCPCFGRRSLTSVEGMTSTGEVATAEYYLFFDVFNYYSLDARRTEARALVSTAEGPREEVASVYITSGNDEDLFLICHRQEVVIDPVTGGSDYRFETLAPSVEEAEACRRDLYTVAGAQEPCQGPACGFEYTKEQLDPGYPPYHDGNFRTPESLLDVIRQRIESVGQMLQTPS